MTLQRTTSGRKLIPEIDGLRFVAIAMVVLFHVRNNYLNRYRGLDYSAIHQNPRPGGWFIDVLGTGHYGVQLFFAISGFILVLPFAAHYLKQETAPSLRRYYQRRLSRLEPPYLAALGVYFIGRTLLSSDIGVFEHLLASVFYLHGTIYNSTSTVMNVAWSLEVEVQFYLLAPLFAKVFLIRQNAARQITLAGMAIGAAVIADLRGAEGSLPGYFLIDYAQYFFIGFIVADLYVRDVPNKPPLAWSGDLLTLTGLVGLVYWALEQQYIAYTTPVCILLLMVGTLSGRYSRVIFSNRILVIIGGACYSIYLYHLFFIAALSPVIAKLLSTIPEFWVLPCYLVSLSSLGIAMSVVPFVLIEKPTMDPRWFTHLCQRVGLSRAKD